MNDRRSEQLTRRGFLRGAGLLLGSLAAPGLSSMMPATAAAQEVGSGVGRSTAALRLGLLLPRSTLYPGMSAQLLAGMNLFFDQAQRLVAGRPVEIVSGEIGVSSLRAEGVAEQLLTERIDLAVGVFNPCLPGALRGRFAARQTPLVALHTGENLPRSGKHDEWVFHNSLSSWQSAWALGAWAARNLGTRAVMAASLYDSGYDSLYAFRRGFEGAGGTIATSPVTHLPQEPQALERAIAAIRQAAPDFVYGAYCGKPALDFVAAYAAAGLHGRVPLVGSAFMVDEQLLSAHGDAALGIISSLPWAPALDTPENRTFSTAFQARTGQAPDAFALLGYETGRLIAAAVQDADGSARPERLALALGAAEFQSPRGQWQMDPASRTPATPLYLREVQRRGGVLENVVLSQLAQPSAQLAELQASPKTGWVNPYLCV